MDIAARILNASLMIAMPLALGVYLARRLKADWGLYGVGVLTFVASQVLHIPFNVWALAPAVRSLGLEGARAGWPLVLLALLYGLSAGIFEETFRYLGYRSWAKEARSWRPALMFGAGHGGIEAIILGGLALYALIQALTLRGVDLSAVFPPESVELARLQLEAYWGAPWYAALLGAVERAAALLFHLSAAIMVLRAITRRTPLWLGAAIVWHTLINAVAVFAALNWNIYIAELLITVFGLASLGLIFLLRDPEKPAPQAPPPAEPAAIEIQPLDPTLENLEDSRYT
jgi:uncharacterized membrane protein YhfC